MWSLKNRTARFTSFDANGRPCVKLPPVANAEGATVTVLATETLGDWSQAALVPMAVDKEDGAWKPAASLADPDYACPPKLFFRWRIDFGRGGERPPTGHLSCAGGRPETFFRLRNGRRYGIIKAVAAARRRKENQ